MGDVEIPVCSVLSVWPACIFVLPCARQVPRRRIGSRAAGPFQGQAGVPVSKEKSAVLSRRQWGKSTPPGRGAVFLVLPAPGSLLGFGFGTPNVSLPTRCTKQGLWIGDKGKLLNPSPHSSINRPPSAIHSEVVVNLLLGVKKADLLPMDGWLLRLSERNQLVRVLMLEYSVAAPLLVPASPHTFPQYLQ